MKRRELLQHLAAAIPAITLPRLAQAAGGPGQEAMAAGPFSPSWASLTAYRTPDWFRNAKFGIWAHWGPQCEPEYGDWYAREMYIEGSAAYKHHLRKYGHPSESGFKEVIRQWRAERWDPDALVGLYKQAGAKYFVALANHHDNFDLYDSKYQPGWNATKLGPKKDLIGGWSKAARRHGLRFGVSVHASHAWSWYEVSRRADQGGPKAGIPYDGGLTQADGKGTWWEGLDPQALYAQNHPLGERSADNGAIHQQWDWGNGASVPSHAYCEKFHDRTIDLINSYDPDLVYFDDTALPLWPASEVGLRIAAHMYNRSVARKGAVEAVINGKILDAVQRKTMVWDIERGQSNQIEALPWQTCTCIGNWHYDRPLYDRKGYKSAQTVVQTLIDVVSKNGNLLLSVPVRGDGTIDEQERAIVEEIGRWMAVNGEGIFDSRPWSVFGEGPVMETAAPISAQGFNEGRNQPFTSADIRYTVKGNAVYAFVMGWPADGKVVLKSMGSASAHLKQRVARVELVGRGDPLPFRQTAEGLLLTLPADAPALSYAVALKVS
ncbi:alpha-L-fucosidase [Duganella sp. BJB488]|uniref:alpha-L-fucosidase n=1 Tax=unclassified Duganella TaxID=2636909 RepID=UPI000E34F811|nr:MULTISPECIES: alpha-L-fucosidase [unclassified Duganella]RFP17863.1 alpha-L-fucosidase [Duganella sp. BJB489]RFP22369.1 alpha-L-fucosidase [Duganella sp. BJB488]RFP37703.1 alpha-L-fucosidase [Duganella sp. BJB480]